MRVLLEVVEKRKTGYYVRIRGWLADSQDEQWVEEFHWGLDVPLVQIQDETKAILLNDHGDHPIEPLIWQGTEWDI